MQRDVVIDCYYMLTLYHKLLLIDFKWINFELLRLWDTVWHLCACNLRGGTLILN